MHFGDESGAPFGDENASQNPVWAVLVLDVFLRPRCSCFLEEMGAPRLQFGSHFGYSSGALSIWKNSSKCVRVVTFEGLTPSKRRLFACLDHGCVWKPGFEQFFEFLASFGGPSGSPFGTDCCPKRGLKKGVQK